MQMRMETMTIRQRAIITAFTVLLAAASGGLSASAGTQSSGTITGVVRVAGEKTGRAGAVVTFEAALLSFRAVTDSNGAFTIDGVPAGSGYVVTAALEGYRPTAVRATVAPGETASADIVLPRAWLEVAFPNGGESIFAGSEVPIRWKSWGISRVKIELTINDGRQWLLLTESADASSGLWVWDVPDIPSHTCIIRITDTGDSGLSDTSDGPFANSSI